MGEVARRKDDVRAACIGAAHLPRIWYNSSMTTTTRRLFCRGAACRAALADAAVKRFGSGWAWLVAKDGKLSVESTANADTPFGLAGVKPLLVVDVWEHAYYLDWQNQRAAYAKAVVEKHLDWSAASRRFAEG